MISVRNFIILGRAGEWLRVANLAKIMELRACPKINLGLHIVRKRTDGFHDIETAIIGLRELYDTVSLTPAGSGSSVLETSGAPLDCPPESNLCMRALRLLQREFGAGEAVVKLHKAVPSGAGLGGGSSDAAAVLRAGNQVFTLGLSDAELETLAARLGSDVPFFIKGTPQICTGRGEIMTPLDLDLAGKWLAVVKPVSIEISTAEAYASVVPREPREPLRELLKRPFEDWKTLIINDFERSVFEKYPQLQELKQSLYRSGAVYASMSGSGSAIFGIFDSRPTLELARNKLIFSHLEQL